MTARIELECQIRSRAGKGAAKAYRRQGLLPGIVYGAGSDPLMVTVLPGVLEKALVKAGSAHALLDLLVQGGSAEDRRLVMIREIQTNPLGNRKYHVDFQAVRADRPLKVRVPLRVLGVPAGLTSDSELEVARREVMVECLPADLPGHIELDVSGLGLGDAIKASELKLPSGVSLVMDGDFVVAKHTTKSEEVPVAAPEGDEGAAGAEQTGSGEG